MANRPKALQVVQVGVETTPGTAVAANRRLPNLKVGIGMMGDNNEEFTGSGNLYPSDVTNSTEWSGGSYELPQTFVEQCYINDSVFKHVTASGAGAAKTRVWTPAVSAADVFDTHTVEHGQAGAIMKFPYVIFNDINFTIAKKGRNPVTGSVLGQNGAPATALTGSPTSVASRPIATTAWNLYTGSSWSNLQSAPTALTGSAKLDFAYGPRYAEEFYIGSAAGSWDAVGTIVPANSVKLTLPYDVTGTDFAGFLSLAAKRAGTTVYLRASALGAVAEAGTPDILEESTIDMALKIRKVPAQTELNVFMGNEWELGLFIDQTAQKAVEWKIVSTLSAK